MLNSPSSEKKDLEHWAIVHRLFLLAYDILSGLEVAKNRQLQQLWPNMSSCCDSSPTPASVHALRISP